MYRNFRCKDEEISKALQPKFDYVLSPYRHKGVDGDIGQDSEIVRIITEFNEKADFSKEEVAFCRKSTNPPVLLPSFLWVSGVPPDQGPTKRVAEMSVCGGAPPHLECFLGV